MAPFLRVIHPLQSLTIAPFFKVTFTRLYINALLGAAAPEEDAAWPPVVPYSVVGVSGVWAGSALVFCSSPRRAPRGSAAV